MSPLEAHFAARGVALAMLPDGARVPARFGDPATEHRATREACALFDFSFMGGWEIAGPDAARCLARLQTREPARVEPGRCAYTLLLREDGTVFNDATLWRLGADRWWLFTGRPSDEAFIAEGAAGGTVRRREPTAVIALQGPSSGAVLARLAGSAAVRGLGWFGFAAFDLPGGSAFVARLGYSGELGYELLVPESRAVALWQAVRAAGESYGLREAGFTAADRLRIECGHVLFLRELARPRLPSQLGLSRLVTSRDPAMRGREALEARSDEPVPRLVGLAMAGSRASNGVPAVELTSEAESPEGGGRIGLGFAPAGKDRAGTVLRDEDGRAWEVTALSRHDPERVRARGNPLP